MLESKISVVIVDDHQLFREGIKRILEMESQFEVVAIGSNGEEACHLAEVYQPDVFLMDINMPIMNGVEATERIKSISPNSRVVVLSIHDDENYVHEVIASGASGYLLKEMDAEALIEAIQVVASGSAYIHPKVTGKLITEYRRLSTLQDSDVARVELSDEVELGRFASLTPREKEVLQLMAEGKSNKGIGDYLYISEKTVKNHVSSILQKLVVNDRTQAVVISIKNGWVKIS